MIGIILLALMTLIISGFAHYYIHSYIIASVGGAAISSFLFCVAAQLIAPDALIGIAFVVGFLYCLVISLCVGLIRVIQQWKRDAQQHKYRR